MFHSLLQFDIMNFWKQNNLQQLVDDPEFSNFFKWMANNITKDNVLTSEEIEQ